MDTWYIPWCIRPRGYAMAHTMDHSMALPMYTPRPKSTHEVPHESSWCIPGARPMPCTVGLLSDKTSCICCTPWHVPWSTPWFMLWCHIFSHGYMVYRKVYPMVHSPHGISLEMSHRAPHDTSHGTAHMNTKGNEVYHGTCHGASNGVCHGKNASMEDPMALCSLSPHGTCP